jgi:hypothetical protein
MSAPSDHDIPSSALAELLRAHAPPELPDDGFTARTMEAVRRARAEGQRPPMLSPAEALALETRRHAAQARAWRWTIAGVFTGALLVFAAMAASPDAGAVPFAAAIGNAPAPPPWLPLWALAFLGALWLAIREFRADP